MPIYLPKEKHTGTVIICFTFFSLLLLSVNLDVCLAAKPKKGARDTVYEDRPGSLQANARLYRDEGFRYQSAGDLDSAMVMYQKAMALDPTYAIPYNDAGIIHEARGEIIEAEECYLRAIKIDPSYLSAYTNVAALYEIKRDLDKASYYWKKRVDLGDPADPWTIKAKRRLEDIGLVTSKDPALYAREQEVLSLLKDVGDKKALLKKDDKAQARDNFERAQKYYDQGDLATALKLAIDAQQLDPDNEEIQEFIDKVQLRSLSK